MEENLTPRQRAGRINRQKRKGITPEGREALRQAALNNRPWERSTGPKSKVGKRQSRTNAIKDFSRATAHLPDVARKFVEGMRLARKGKGPVPDYKEVLAFMNTLDFKNDEALRLWIRLKFEVSHCLMLKGEQYASSQGQLIQAAWFRRL